MRAHFNVLSLFLFFFLIPGRNSLRYLEQLAVSSPSYWFSNSFLKPLKSSLLQAIQVVRDISITCTFTDNRGPYFLRFKVFGPPENTVLILKTVNFFAATLSQFGLTFLFVKTKTKLFLMISKKKKKKRNHL